MPRCRRTRAEQHQGQADGRHQTHRRRDEMQHHRAQRPPGSPTPNRSSPRPRSTGRARSSRPAEAVGIAREWGVPPRTVARPSQNTMVATNIKPPGMPKAMRGPQGLERQRYQQRGEEGAEIDDPVEGIEDHPGQVLVGLIKLLAHEGRHTGLDASRAQGDQEQPGYRTPPDLSVNIARQALPAQ